VPDDVDYIWLSAFLGGYAELVNRGRLHSAVASREAATGAGRRSSARDKKTRETLRRVVDVETLERARAAHD